MSCATAPECEPAVARRSRRRSARRLLLRNRALFIWACPMPRLRNLINREVRRTRNIQASIRVQDRTLTECRVMDNSHGGANISTTVVPDRFELAFAEGGQTRSCEVIWRHGK